MRTLDSAHGRAGLERAGEVRRVRKWVRDRLRNQPNLAHAARACADVLEGNPPELASLPVLDLLGYCRFMRTSIAARHLAACDISLDAALVDLDGPARGALVGVLRQPGRVERHRASRRSADRSTAEPARLRADLAEAEADARHWHDRATRAEAEARETERRLVVAERDADSGWAAAEARCLECGVRLVRKDGWVEDAA